MLIVILLFNGAVYTLRDPTSRTSCKKETDKKGFFSHPKISKPGKVVTRNTCNCYEISLRSMYRNSQS